jgi:tRNA threonylcarbamoyladenosine biosynthesis protein TsaE
MKSQMVLKENFPGSEAKTRKIGETLAKELNKKDPGKTALVLGLQGELGGGKTTFLQGVAKGLGIKEKILSPTFVMMKRFGIPKGNFQNFFHFDCYRIQGSKDLSALGVEKIIANPKNIIAIEWAEKIKDILPKKTIWLKFIFINDKKRKINILF